MSFVVIILMVSLIPVFMKGMFWLVTPKELKDGSRYYFAGMMKVGPKRRYCRDERHGIPCPLPCRACEKECDPNMADPFEEREPLPKATVRRRT